MTMTDTPVDNGVNTEALLGARAALSEAPEAADFTWRATCSWVHGTHSRTTVDGFSGLGQDHQHRTTFTFDADHPECFASEDPAPRRPSTSSLRWPAASPLVSPPSPSSVRSSCARSRPRSRAR